MRLLTICHMFPCQLMPRYGVFLIRQSQYLRQHGIDITFLVPRPYAPWPLHKLPRFKEYGPQNPLLIQPNQNVQSVRYFRLPGAWFRKLEGKSILSAIRPAATKLHAKHNFDAILTSPLLPDAWAAFQVSREIKLPIGMLSIGSDVMVYPHSDKSLEAQLRDILPKAELTVGVSQAICDKMQSYGATQPLCVYLGRDQSLFSPAIDRPKLRASLNLQPQTILGLMVSRLTNEKGIQELCAACNNLFRQHPNFKMICVGNGSARGQIEALARQSGNEGRIKATGEIPPNSIPNYLQAADFFVLPSYSEGMPQAVLEAMNCGLPVIGTQVGGIPEAVTHEVNGLLIPPKNTVELESAMSRMIGDSHFRREAGRKSLEIAGEKFDSEKNATKLADALKGLMSRS